ncbi:MAG: hypothetical protein WC117_00275 [Sphaerochaetaceae bacterium]
MSFVKFSSATHARYNAMAQAGELFESTITGDELWAAYLSSFPAGTNEIFRERTEHDCSCCRNFIKNLGRVVSIQAGEIKTVWSDIGLEYPYDLVAAHLDAVVQNAGINGVYRTKEKSYGAEYNLELIDGKSHRWNHFHGAVHPAQFSTTPGKAIGDINSTIAVFERGLKEIPDEVTKTVLDLIDNNSIYRGEEFWAAVNSFHTLQQHYAASSVKQKEVFPFEFYKEIGARIRNTAIGSLLQDLAEGVELGRAVASFEAKVAPTNYKRTTALITPVMIKAALTKLKELGLEEAVNRRFAKLSDVSINNVIWASGSSKAVMKDSLSDRMMASKQVKKKPVSVVGDNMPIDVFMDEIVPKAASMKLLMKNPLVPNLVSLTAPADTAVGQLFKWDNDFAWSYNGNITDSIKEKVKRAGGNTDAKLRVSLSWFNPDDLDIHCVAPEGHICFRDKMGVLDVDMNAWGPKSDTDPVENLSWKNPRDGKYVVSIHQYDQRTKDRPGFIIEVENNGQLSQYSYNKVVSGTVQAISFQVHNGVIIELDVGAGLIGGGITQKVWGIETETLVPVTTLMYSPNYWDENQVGNKHWLFMLEGCLNDKPARGIYNEYLRNDLAEHRKVFEVLGAETMCPVVNEQLSGVGFSSTKEQVVTVQVTAYTGEVTTHNIQF